MKVYNNKIKDTGYFIYRMAVPVFDPLHFINGLKGYVWYLRDYFKFKKLSGGKLRLSHNLFPSLHDKTRLTPFDAQYFHQQIWLFEDVLKIKPTQHVDVASTYEMSGYLSKIVPTAFIDIRPIDTKLKNLKIIDASILDLPFEDNSVESLSCLHVVEHIGLGRYGDPIDPEGMNKACKELSRVLRKGGQLYFSTPVGKKRLCFNSHRITPPAEILELFGDLTLVSFSGVNDNGEFVENVSPESFKSQDYACGMFIFRKD